MERAMIKDINLFLFDMDGTLYAGERVFDFTVDLLRTIKHAGKKYLFMTNNSSCSVEDYTERLEKLGIESEKEDYMTASQATELYLAKHYKQKKLYVCGTESFKRELREEGFELTDELSKVECVVMSNDTELTFKKLDDVSRLLSEKDLPYIATNPDYTCTTEYGSVPDCGSFCEMIYRATGKRPVFIGKPEPTMPYIAMERTGYNKSETAIVGDRIYTDIKCGINAGITSILVMTGDTDHDTLESSPDKPDIVLNDCGEIMDILNFQ